MQMNENEIGIELPVEDGLVMAPVIGKEQIQQAMLTLRKYMAGKASFDKRVVENNEWWKLRHWDYMKEQGTTGLKTKSAWLVNVILTKHADAMDAVPEPNCLPRAEDDKPEAMKLSKILPVVLENAKFVEAWDENWYKKLKYGVGIYGVFWDASEHNGIGDVAVRAVDPLQLFWEPGVRDIQKSRNVFYVYLEDNDSLKETYPQLEDKLRNGKAFSMREYLYDDNVDTSDKSMVVDWYYKKHEGGRTVLHYCKFVGDEILYASENEAQNSAGEVAETGMPPADDSMTMQGYYQHGKYPFVFDVLFPEEGTPTGYGFIDICKDPQRQIDLMNTAIVANCVAAATPRWLKRGEDGINEEEYADWTRPFVHVQGSLDDAAIRPIPVQMLTGNYIAILEGKVNEMKETSGNRDVNAGGAPSGVTAASAIAALQEQGGKLSRDQIRKSYNCFRDICYFAIEVIREFYDAPRTFRITGPTGEDEYTRYDNTGLLVSGGINPMTGLQKIRKPLFDIKVAPQKQTEYNKMANNELAIQFYRLGFFNPMAADAALACLEMMDFDGKEEIRQRIQHNQTLLMALQMAQAENAMLKAKLGIPVEPTVGPADGGTGIPPTTDGPARIPQADEQGGAASPNRVADRAKAKAQAATQPR